MQRLISDHLGVISGHLGPSCDGTPAVQRPAPAASLRTRRAASPAPPPPPPREPRGRLTWPARAPPPPPLASSAPPPARKEPAALLLLRRPPRRRRRLLGPRCRRPRLRRHRQELRLLRTDVRLRVRRAGRRWASGEEIRPPWLWTRPTILLPPVPASSPRPLLPPGLRIPPTRPPRSPLSRRAPPAPGRAALALGRCRPAQRERQR